MVENDPADCHGHQQETSEEQQQPGKYPPDAGLRGQNAPLGQAMLNAAQLAVFDVADKYFELMPRDTVSNESGSEVCPADGVAFGDLPYRPRVGVAVVIRAGPDRPPLSRVCRNARTATSSGLSQRRRLFVSTESLPSRYDSITAGWT